MPALFWRVVGDRGRRVAMREKKFGVWQSITWESYGERAKHVGLALLSLGLERRDCVAIVSDNRPEWLYSDMGILGAGGITVGVYATDAPKQLEYLINDCRAKFIFVENEEQLDKVLAVRGRAPALGTIIVYDMEALRDLRDDMVMSFEALLGLGKDYENNHPGLWEQRLEQPDLDDLAILIYTSGTTGPPKGAMISHRNILFQIGNSKLLQAVENEEILSFLPLCHIAERNFTTFRPLATGAVVNFAENLETVPENIREISPTGFFAVPRIWEKFYSTVTIAIREATALQQWAYKTALTVGVKVAERKMEQRPVPFGLGLLFRVCDVLLLKNIKRILGLDRARWLVTGAAPISPDLIKWYLALGFDMVEVYGQTENTGLATIYLSPQIKVGTVGKAAPGTEVSISPEGEILLKGPHVFLGYFNMPDKTKETLVDGWLHTGDMGYLDNEGYLKITDRMKDIIITAGGKNITPSEIENQLKFSPYVSDAVVVGDERRYLACLIMIDHDNVAKFAQDGDVPFTNFASLCRAPEVLGLIQVEVDKVNKDLARVEQVKKFRLIDVQLTPEDDELTPTMKLKRKFVNEKYKELIESMYHEAAAA